MFSIFAAFGEVRQFEHTNIAIYNLMLTKSHTDIVFLLLSPEIYYSSDINYISAIYVFLYTYS